MKALIRTVLGVLLFSSSIGLTHAQKDSYELKLKSGKYLLNNNISTFKTTDLGTQSLYNGSYYCYIQFSSIPSTEEKKALKSAGVTLLNYLPDYYFVAKLSPGVDVSTLPSYSIEGIHKIEGAYKINEALYYQNFPDHAIEGDQVKLNLSFYSGIDQIKALENLTESGAVVLSDYAYARKATIQIDKANFMKFVNLAYVASVEAIDPKAIKENLVGRTNHRSNFISNPVTNSTPYNGDGVWVALGDDGEIGPHIDYTGRTDQSNVGPDGGNHGDHIAGTIMGAGNLDPTTRGMAWGADLLVYDVWDAVNSTPTSYTNPGVVVTSTSYGNGCNAGYTGFAQTADMQIRQMPNLMHVFSAGNSGTSDCGYGAGSGWGNITGGIKAGKNVMAVGNMTATDGLANSSSRGPAEDGRIKPDICAVGSNVYSTNAGNVYNNSSGTSMAAPGISGSYAQLVHAFREMNGGQTPESALIKSAMLNTADDKGNTGPDFRYGWGRVNVRKALALLEDNRYLDATISQGGNNTHTLNVPAGVKQLKVMVYWADYEGATNASVALVNNLDLVLEDNGGTTYMPYVLDHTPNAALLNTPATTGVDALNNMEQVALDNPVAGSYTVKVSGTTIPQGPQKYYVLYEYVMDDITLTYPIGGEGLVPNEVEIIRWDGYDDSGSYLIEYTTDNGVSWNTITNSLAGTARLYNWNVPSVVSGEVKLKISKNGVSDESDSTFSIIGVPSNLQVQYSCPDSFGLSWTAVNGATAYEVSVLGNMYMDSITTVTTNNAAVVGLNPNQAYWVSVKALTNTAIGRRALAIEKQSGIYNCIVNEDLGIAEVLSPANVYLSCSSGTSVPVSVVVENPGLVNQNGFDLSYTYNNGAVVTETFNNVLLPGDTVHVTFSASLNINPAGSAPFSIWLANNSDDNSYNDTVQQNVVIINSGAVTAYPFTEDFDSFSGCPTSSDCGGTNCNLGNNWTNLSNGVYDGIDWRVNSGSTPSQNTGPTGDHTGNGRYLYLEASGNCTFQEAVAITPCVNLQNANSPEFSFWYHMSGFSVGELHVDVMVDGVWQNDIVPALIGNQGGNWTKVTANFVPFAGKVVTVRFRGITGDDYASDIAIDDVSIGESILIPTADFNISNNDVCTEVSVNLTDASANAPNAWTWTVTPSNVNFLNNTTAQSQNPVIEFTQSGNYVVELAASNSNGTDILTKNVTVTAPTEADFAWVYDYVNQTMTFTNNSLNLGNSSWDFGDGNSSTDVSPVHNYPIGNQYKVSLITTNKCGADTMTRTVNTWPVSVGDLSRNENVVVYPNPAIHEIYVEFKEVDNQDVEIKLFDLKGAVLISKTVNTTKSRQTIEVDQLAKGIYYLSVRGTSFENIEKLVVQ